MRKRNRSTEEKPARRPVLIDGIEFEERRLLFSRLTSKNGLFALRFSKAPVFKSDVDLRVSADDEAAEESGIADYVEKEKLTYVFYDRGKQEILIVDHATVRDGWLYFKSPFIPDAHYETGVYRYLPAAIDWKKRILYSFTYTKNTFTTEYDYYENVLTNQVVGETEAGDPVQETFYITRKDKTLRVVIQRQFIGLRDFLEGKIRTVSLRDGVLGLKIELRDHGFHISRIFIRLRSKTEQIEHDFEFTEKTFGDMIFMDARLDLKPIQMGQFYWDIKALAVKDGSEREIQLRNYGRWMHRILYLIQLHYDYPDGNTVYPYKTKSKNIALQYRPKTAEDSWKFIFKEYVALAIYFLVGWFLKRRKIWLVYEKYSKSAQDNSLYFFEYCMKQLPDKEKNRIYYVIDKQSPDYRYVAPYEKHVIQFLSLKHMVYLMSAQLLISSDTRAHAYAWRSPNSVYRNMLVRKKNVFLQHGVMAFKCCHQGLRKKSFNSSKLFVVSSDVEKQIILDYFGYKEEEILVTGLARWDVLKDKSEGEPRQIILMPTWRTWLEEVSKEVFIASEYYQHYMALLNDPRLMDVLKQYGIKLNFYIHPKFQEYMETFSADPEYVRLIPFGEEPLNELMMKCSMMITDYSSAVWDVFYQGKPVLFYLFDLDLYNEVQGSYIDMETETFGDVSHTPEELVALIAEYAENGFKEKEKYAAMRPSLIKYIDDQNSARTYQGIVDYLAIEAERAQ